ncbi:hypothetical protein IW261DRAFT_1609778 [Armillaria novae-zelandiae]|uniref:Uncharacterized protein n=1 Tax=Armillaria novae-zelandiae TaxID=153914 RepID=A0AA39TAH7_9AGAR|nr:hypothetical protein IW261DRAFT_1609778 [Armillaria novae-zelandiae]
MIPTRPELRHVSSFDIEQAELGASSFAQPTLRQSSASRQYPPVSERWDEVLIEILHSKAPTDYCAYQELSSAYAEIFRLSDESRKQLKGLTEAHLETMKSSLHDFLRCGRQIDDACQELIDHILDIVGENDIVVFDDQTRQRCSKICLQIDSEVNILRELVDKPMKLKYNSSILIATITHRFTRSCSIAGFLLSGALTLYASVATDVSEAYKITGAGLSIFQGTMGSAGKSSVC